MDAPNIRIVLYACKQKLDVIVEVTDYFLKTLVIIHDYGTILFDKRFLE